MPERASLLSILLLNDHTVDREGRTVKLAGVMLVRDESDVLAVNLRHHLGVVDELLVIDNGSSDTTPEVLRRFARRSPSLRWTTDAGPFLQSQLTTELAHEARRGGAHWVVPIDADELWSIDRPTLEQAAPDVGAFRVPVVSYVQARWVHTAHRRNLLTMTRRVDTPIGPYESVGGLVDLGHIAFVEGEYPPKVITRTADTLVVGPGNHDVDGVTGTVVATDAMVCLHAPLRSREHLSRRARNAARLDNADFGEGLAWQARRWGGLDERGLDREWRANSYAGVADLALDVHGFDHDLVVDTRLRDTVLPHIPLRDRARASLSWRLRRARTRRGVREAPRVRTTES